MKQICCLFIGLFTTVNLVYSQNQQDELPIKTIELVHHTHTDIGYTDNPIIVNDLHKRYIDIALDAIMATIDGPEDQKFYWTAEAIEPVYAWWQEASPERRVLFLKALKSKQLDVNALPFTIVPFTNERQNNVMANWIPERLWKQLNPTFGLMNDVNGFSRSLALSLLDKNINRIWLSINLEWGGSPFKQPYAFWWKMPDGRKSLVWLNTPYWIGYELFNEAIWVRGWEQASSTQFRLPRKGDILTADDSSVYKAHEVCVKTLQKLVKEGYPFDFIAYSITNQWRIDNDGPMPHLVDFVNKWNKLGLKPAIHLTTVSGALDFIEKRIGNVIPTYEGEFTDGWSFGGSAAPREMAAARMADNYIHAVKSPIWGGNDSIINRNVYEMDKELCLFAEHTFAANQSANRPYDFYNQGHIAEKNILAYRPYEKAKWLLAQRTRNLLTNESEGLYIINTGETPYTGWIMLNADCFRGLPFKSVINTENDKKAPLFFEDNSGYMFPTEAAKFWVEQLPASKITRFMPGLDSIPAEKAITMPDIKTDNNGWPVSAQWKGMDKPLFVGEMAGFSSLESTVGRELQSKCWTETNAELRAKKVKENTKELWATAIEKTKVTESAYSIIYEQKVAHPRLNWAVRKLEIWKNEPRTQITFKIDRISSNNPEIFYLTFAMPKTDAFPTVSNGGVEFMPYKGQIPGSSTDQFAIDGWVNYASKAGSWVWSSRDMPNISFGSQQFAVKSATPPANMNIIAAMIYNNLWHVNYQDNYPGEMTFQFDLFWKNKGLYKNEVSKIVQTYYLPPTIMVNPATRENPIIYKRMNAIK